MYKLISLVILAVFSVAGCSSGGVKVAHIDITNLKNAIPKYEPYSKRGNRPYQVFGKTYVPIRTAAGFEQRGIASWYGKKFHGNPTSNGEIYDMYAMTAAHKTLPLPCYVSVTNLNNNRRVIVRVNDRGPFVGDRIIDLSYSAASKLDMVGPGTAPVLVKAVPPPTHVYDHLPELKHYLSVGVFADQSNAENLRRKLKNAGFGLTHVKQRKSSGRAIYQVRIGPIELDDAVDSLTSRVKKHISEDPVLVTE
ncbi:MAG: septal ring lytic transglycosylase RlpA family protein [Acidiferrobacterales bacterium]|nr:septal ring lytic transglycosylase RlpA family protein [Acidiferrobacterales bacterium]